MKKAIKLIAALVIIGTTFTSCTQEEAPIPQIQLTMWDTMAGTYTFDIFSSDHSDEEMKRFSDTVVLEANPFIYKPGGRGNFSWFSSELITEYKLIRTDSTLTLLNKQFLDETFTYHIQNETIVSKGTLGGEIRTVVCKKLKL